MCEAINFNKLHKRLFNKERNIYVEKKTCVEGVSSVSASYPRKVKVQLRFIMFHFFIKALKRNVGKKNVYVGFYFELCLNNAKYILLIRLLSEMLLQNKTEKEHCFSRTAQTSRGR